MSLAPRAGGADGQLLALVNGPCLFPARGRCSFFGFRIRHFVFFSPARDAAPGVIGFVVLS